MRFEIDVKGMASAIAALQKLANEMSVKVTRRAVNQAAKPLVAAMTANAPVDVTSRPGGSKPHGGYLAASMGVRTKQYTNLGLTVGICGVKRKQPGNRGRVVHLIEFGHRIAARKSGTLPRLDGRKAGKSRVTGERAGGTQAGFVPANPFMRRSYMQTKDVVSTIMQNELVAGINKATATARSKVT